MDSSVFWYKIRSLLLLLLTFGFLTCIVYEHNCDVKFHNFRNSKTVD